ncbi:MAG: FHA domain-containing protein [Rhodocyclaceae bacterium]|nr:FHA domain-containing protein [Rhodocyclaceae bacterium]MDP1957292.1 FHA domain-containing protein [Rhodocyclaceae bacterium]
MAKLILSMDNLVLKEIPLNKERTTLGRKAHNDIQIDNLAVSGEHAVIVSILNDSFLEDLNSTNGTFVNGQQIKKHFLQNNDVIELGKYRLKYINEAPQHAAQADFEKTMVLRPDMLRKPAEPAAAAPLGAVQILTGSNTGRQLELTKSHTTLGRPGIQVAVIARRPIGYFLTHVEGARYPLVNGAAIHTQAHELKDHDVIELAGVKMEFFLKG